MSSILDASAIIALIRDEPVADELLAVVEEGSLVSAANLAESRAG